MSSKPAPLQKNASRNKMVSSAGQKGQPGSGKCRIKSGNSVRDESVDEERVSLAYRILPAELTQEILDLKDVLDVQSKIVEFEGLHDHETDLKVASIMDYYVSGFWWCKKQGYDQQLTSAVYTVLHILLENIRDKNLSLVANLQEFKKLFAGVGIDGCDLSGGLDFIELFQARDIIEYFHIGVFQHYKLYEFVFTTTQAEEIIGTDLDIEITKPADLPWPPPMDEGVPEQIYLKHIATPPPSPPPEVATDDKETLQEGATVAPGEGHSEQNEREAELLSSLSPEEIKDILLSVAKDMLGGLQSEIASKLKERETSIINRINKIHRIADNSL